ncbi:Bacteriorhodopsin [Halapricum desulfuricans]|uniref:Bacteriorhodopsin n=1 Tax=Halapricum desulfuricans TaxID=2841257 RepID=A0A897NPU7_9EURY|nr:bacteriorhodopsin [Halapricum desulfuricans]QSG12859.1 Bacteriorhodopsin [Halapricum desulfuricans]
MDLTITTWFALGTVGMAAGTIGLAAGYTRLSDPHRIPFLDLVAVTAIATVAYGLMALDLGAVTSARGATLYVPRYVDWLLTTPLHIVYVGWLAGADRSTLAKLAALQASTIVLGFAGGMVAAPLNLALFAAGAVVFGVLIYLLYTDISELAHERDDMTLALYRTLRNFVVVLWLVYPVIWLLGGPGIGFMDTETASLVVTYIDVVAKVGFGLIAYSTLRDIEFLSADSAMATSAD